MSQTAITKAFELWLVDKTVNGEPARPDKMVFALIPGQDENAEIDRNEGMPNPGQIRHTAEITQFGALNENAVVYSVVLDTTIGNWAYNWVGLVDSASNTVLMIVHLAEHQKIKTENGQQGNSLIRNLSMEFDGAATASQITVTPATWMIDFSARLHSMDEYRRLANIDYYGDAAFRGEGFKVSVTGTTATIAPGLGYVAGLRAILNNSQALALAGKKGVWVDITWSGTVTGAWASTFTLRAADTLADYVDSAGFQHFVTRIATVSGTAVTDERKPFPLDALRSDVDDLDVYSREESDARFLQITRYLSEIEQAGTPAQAQARANLDVYSRTEAGNAFVKKAGDTMTGILKNSAEIQSTSANSFRMVSGSYGAFWRNDGTTFYLMLTNSGDQYGSYNGYRPLAVDIATGAAMINGAAPYSKKNCPFPIGYVMLVGNSLDPRAEYPGTDWLDLTGNYAGRAITVGATPFQTGGSNTATLSAANLPPHSHGIRGYRSNTALDGGESNRHSIDSTAGFINGLIEDAGSGTAFSVQNAYVTLRAWMRVS